MTFSEKTVRRTLKTSDGTCGVKITYPDVSNASGCKNINKFLNLCAEKFTKYCKAFAENGKIFELKTKITFCDGKICSMFFEKTERIGRKITSYKPFSATFCLKSGALLSLPAARKNLSGQYPALRIKAKRNGIKISFDEFCRKYYLTENGAVIYKSAFSPVLGVKNTSECIRKFIIG